MEQKLKDEIRKYKNEYLMQGMDDFEAHIRAVHHIILPPQPELTKEEVEERKLFHEFCKEFDASNPSFEERFYHTFDRFREWKDQRLFLTECPQTS